MIYVTEPSISQPMELNEVMQEGNPEENLGVAKPRMGSDSILDASEDRPPAEASNLETLEEDSKEDEGGEEEEPLSNTLRELEAQVEKLKAERQTLEERINWYKTALVDSTKKVSDLVSQHKRDMDNIMAAQSQGGNQVITVALEKGKKLNEQLQFEIKYVKGENSIFEQQNKNLNTKANRLQGENNELKEYYTRLEDQGAELSTKSNDLQIRNNRLEAQIIPLEQTNKQLETQVSSLNLKAAMLKEERDQFEKEKDQKKTGYLRLISDLSDQNSLLRVQAEEEGDRQEEAIKDLKRELTTIKSSLIRTQEELNVYKSKEAMAKNTMVPTPHIGTTQMATTQAGRELEGRICRLMIESETIAEKIKQDVIKSEEDMEQMRSDVIKDGISLKGRMSRTKAMDEIMEFKRTLRYFQSDADCGLIPATKEHKERIKKEIEKQDMLMSAVAQTDLDFIKESEQRNIRLIEMNQEDSKMLVSSTSKFTGEGSLHIYKFIKNMNTHLKQRGILHEDSGLILRQFCSGEAKTILDDRLRDMANPKPEEIKRILVAHFGNRERILLKIQKEHELLGQIPHPYLPGGASRSLSLSESHLSLLDNIEMLIKETPYDLDQTISIDLGELNLRDYTESMLPLLPIEFFREFRKALRNTNASDTIRLEKLKTILSDIKITAFENIQSQTMEEESIG